MVLLFGCSSKRQEIGQLDDNFKLRTLESILLDTTTNLFNEELIFANKGRVLPSSLGGFSSELSYIMDILNEPDTNFIKSQFRNRKDFSLIPLNSSKIQILPCTVLYSIQNILLHHVLRNVTQNSKCSNLKETFLY